MVKEFTYLSLFAQAPARSFSLQEFEDHHGTPHQTVRRYLDRLVRQGVLVEDKRKRFRFYRLVPDNPFTLDALSICEKLRLRQRLTDDPLFEELYISLSKYFPTCKFLLFGSATTAQEYNDFDVLCFGDCAAAEKTVGDFEKAFGKPVELLGTTPRSVSDTLRGELINKHIILNDHDWFVRYLLGEDQVG